MLGLLKLQWEELQVKELQSRLSRLERQIGQRKELREKIINRRAGELIEGDASRWDSTGASAEKPVGTAATSKPNAKLFNSVAASELTTQIHFTGPKGMEVLIAGEPEELIAPVRHSFLRHASDTQRYDIGFMKAPGAPDLQFLALLDIFPSTPATEEFLRHNTVPITITDEDTRHASSELLIKVIYLKKPSSVKTAIPEVHTLLSTHLNTGGDVIAAANQFGTILAVLRLAQNVDQLGKLDPKSNNAAITRPRLASQQDVKQEVAERSASSQSSAEPTALPSYQEFAKKLWTMDSSVSESEDALSRAERDAGNDVVIDTVPRARRRFEEAIRNKKAIQYEYAAVLRDLELQVESAQAEVDAAKLNADRRKQAVEQGASPVRQSEEAQLRLKQATLTLEQLKVRYELYKKAGEGLKDTQSKDEATSLNATKLVSQREAMPQVTIDFPMANFPVIPGNRIEVQHVLHAEDGFDGPAKTIASGLEVVGVARSVSKPTRTALTLATTPEVAAMLEHSATTGLLFCHPLDPVAMLPCGRAVRIPLGIRQEGRLAVGDLVHVDSMSLAIGKNNLAEPKFAGFATGLLIGFEEGDIPEGTTEPKGRTTHFVNLFRQ